VTQDTLIQRLSMKIKSWTLFIGGVVIGLASVVPFSYMQHASKFQVEKCDRVVATIIDVSADLKKNSGRQLGWIIGLKEFGFKIRIVGEYYNTLDHAAFKKLVKPGSTVELLLVKPSEYGLFEKINRSQGLRDAAGMTIDGTEVLSIIKLRKNLESLFVSNLIFGILALGAGAFFVYFSTKNQENR
jgi:hypothetical protein